MNDIQQWIDEATRLDAEGRYAEASACDETVVRMVTATVGSAPPVAQISGEIIKACQRAREHTYMKWNSWLYEDVTRHIDPILKQIEQMARQISSAPAPTTPVSPPTSKVNAPPAARAASDGSEVRTSQIQYVRNMNRAFGYIHSELNYIAQLFTKMGAMPGYEAYNQQGHALVIQAHNVLNAVAQQLKQKHHLVPTK